MPETEAKYHQPADDSWSPWEAAAGLQPAPVRVPVEGGIGGRCLTERRCCRKRWRRVIRVLGAVKEKGTGKQGAQGSSAEWERGRTH